ncbi:host specificity protein J [Pseudomonas putida]|uniref:Phage tail protein n=1 Tax=Pseudomonas putida TaxID=303 RepID=A0A9X8EGT1_PSEPU|nr:phage tail protein [Pseudomonas putida]ROQ49091.1 putative phage tail protein [Pseudomonas putida]
MSAVAARPQASRKRVAGAKGGSSKPKQPSIASNSTPSIATARIVYLWSWGPIVGPVDGLRSIKLGGTPIQAANGTMNYPGVKWQFRSGELNQPRLDGIAESSNEIGVSQELRSTTPYIYTVTNSMVDAVRVRFSWPQLQSQDKSGNINGVRIDYAIDVATDSGPYQQVLASSVNRKNITKYERSHRINLPEGSRWSVRARRITPEANSSLVQDGMWIDAIAEVVDSDQEYPLTAVGCLEYDAEQFGGDIAKVAALMRGRIVSVPANYEPETRTYHTSGPGTTNGVWNGTFKQAYTNNPAWVFYDLVLHPYYGLGERIDSTQIDRWSLYRIAQYCDQLVPNGAGGQEPRFTCNLYLQKQAEAYAVLQDLTSIFHGMAFWDGSQIVVNADMPSDPVYTYTPSQILGDGAIKYSGSRLRDRHSLAIVAWDNPAQGFETDKEPIFDDEAMAEIGVREVSVEALGCTSLGQAQRAGQWALMTEQLQTRGATIRVGLDGHIPRPGQVIALSDPMLSGRANGGRIAAVAGRVITLDRDTEVTPGARLLVNLPSGKSETRQVRSVAGRAVTVIADFSEAPQPECAWALDFDDLKLMQFFVRNVTRPEWHQFQFELIQHEPEKFDVIDYGAVIDDRPISVLPPGVQEAPAQVLIRSHSSIEQGLAVTTMTIGWDAAPGAVAYEVEWRWGARDWIKLPRTGELSADVRGVYAGQYLARVRAVNAMNVASMPASSMLTEVAGKTTPPPAVTHLLATSELFAIGLKWGFPPGAEDTQRTEIWYSPSNDLSVATKLTDLAYPQRDFMLQGLAAGVSFFFWARLVDRTGNLGPWYPVDNGVLGQSGMDASPILDLIAGQIGETELDKELIDKIDGLQDQIDALDGLKAYDPGEPYVKDQMVVVDGRIYQAKGPVPADASGANSPPNANLWIDVGQSVQAANGLAQQVQTNKTNIETVDGKVTATAESLQALRASARDADAEGDLAGALHQWDATAAFAEEVKVSASRDEVIVRKTETLEATMNDTTAAVQTISQAQVNADEKARTMWAVKMQLTAQGQYVAAGIGLGIENGPAGLQSQFLVSADRFAVVSTLSSGQLFTPFVVEAGQVFMSQTFIQDGTITNAKIGSFISSTNYVPGVQGWRLNKDGTLEINGAIAGQGRLTITHRAVKVFDSNDRLRVQLGDLTA